MRSLWAVILLCLTCSVARADDDPSVDLARRHYQAASAYFEEGKFDDAIREFRESYRLSHRVDLLFNIGQSFLRKGDAARAIDAFEEYLWDRPNSADKVAIETTVAKLKKQVGHVRINDAPPGAVLAIDGFQVGVAPLNKTVLATVGKRMVTAAPSDGLAVRRVEITVLPDGEAVAVLPTPKEKVVEKVVVQEKLVEVSTRRWFESKPGWVLTVGGVLVGAVVGGTLLGLARPTASDAAKATDEQAYLSLRDKAFALQWSGVAMLAIGGAALITGVALFTVKSRERTRPASATAWIAPTVGGLVAGGTF